MAGSLYLDLSYYSDSVKQNVARTDTHEKLAADISANTKGAWRIPYCPDTRDPKVVN